jgi:hypothetical protein
MTLRKLLRSLAVATALLALLVFTTEIGEAIEAAQHHVCSANPNCLICHLGQQVAGSAAQAQAVAAPERLGNALVPQDTPFNPCFRAPQLTTRAPPFA